MNDYEDRQAARDREYVQACKAAGIKPDVSYIIKPHNFTGEDDLVDRGYENDQSVLITLPPEPEFTEERRREESFYLFSLRWARGSVAKSLAVEIVAGGELREVAKVAKEHRLSADR